MVEPRGEISVRPESLINNPQLGEKINLFLSEPIPPQEGFLTRKEWQQQLGQSLASDENTLIVFIDIAGAGNLGKEISSRVAQFIADIGFWQGEQLAMGRQSQAQKRQAGSDEFLVFAQVSDPIKVVESIAQLAASLNLGYDHNQAHLGAAFVPGNTKISSSLALRGADIALKTAKEANKDEKRTKDSNPKLLVFSYNPTPKELEANIEGQAIEEKSFLTSPVVFPEGIITENAVDQLRAKTNRKNSPAIVVSPARMKEINRAGMTKGDQILQTIAEKLVKILTEKAPEGESAIYKIGPSFVVLAEITPEELETISQFTPHGLEWSKLNQPSLPSPEK